MSSVQSTASQERRRPSAPPLRSLAAPRPVLRAQSAAVVRPRLGVPRDRALASCIDATRIRSALGYQGIVPRVPPADAGWQGLVGRWRRGGPDERDPLPTGAIRVAA